MPRDIVMDGESLGVRDVILSEEFRPRLILGLLMMGGARIFTKFYLKRYGRTMPYVVCKVADHITTKLPVLPFQGIFPSVRGVSFLAPSSTVVGDVTVGAKSSIWFKAILRGDVNKINIGNNVHIQDGVIVHVAKNGLKGVPIPTVIGNNVVVGANSLLHACSLAGNNIIGPNSQILDGSSLEENSILMPGSILTPGKTVGSGQLWGGVPAKFVRDLTPQEIASIVLEADEAYNLACSHDVEAKKPLAEYLKEQVIRQNYNPNDLSVMNTQPSPHDPKPSTQHLY